MLSRMIRVGRKTDRSTPSFPGFTPIIVLTKSSEYGDLGPYELKDEQGRIMENVYQYSKVYASVPESTQRYSRWDPKIIWNWPAEQHVVGTTVNQNYWRWRQAGMNNPYPVRYPVGFYQRKNCICSISDQGEALDYVGSRKKIYYPLYVRLVKNQKRFWDLYQRVRNGENLLIIEVDGPHQESLEYYKEKYQVKDDFIQNNTTLVTPENMKIMLEDTKHPFGHGYCLGMALMDLTI